MRLMHFPFQRLRLSFLIISIVVLLSSFTVIKAQSAGGLWGSVKEKIKPINDTIKTKYNRLSDRNRFLTGACVGFSASRIVIGSEYTCMFIHVFANANRYAILYNILIYQLRVFLQ